MKISAKTTVLAFGELLWDLLPSGPQLGGAPANFAFRLNSFGRKTLPVSRVGNDSYGEEAIQKLRAHGVDTGLIQKDYKHPTGTVAVTLGANGDASYTINTNVAFDYIELNSELLSAAKECQVIYFGTLIQRNQVSQQTLYDLIDAAPQAIKLLDLNLRKDCHTSQVIKESLKKCDILKLNEEEAQIVAALWKQNAKTLSEIGKWLLDEFSIETCIITRGKDGAYSISRDGKEAWSAGIPVKVVDTVGAGDSFTAAFLDAKLQGKTVQQCCDFGNKIGALVAGRSGGMCEINELYCK